MIDAHIHHQFTTNFAQQELEDLKRKLKAHGIDQSILYLIYDNDITDKNYMLSFGESIIPSVMLDPKDGQVSEKLLDIKRAGIKMIKILPYEQQLYYEDYPLVCNFAQQIQEQEMVLTICGSYGSKNVYKTNGVELAAAVLNSGFTNPLILAHGGMVRQLDVYSLMVEYPNLYMDLSFTIKYWWGSHIIQDLYFTLNKFNFMRAFYGSDYPNMTLKEAREYFDRFCDMFEIAEMDRKKLLEGNFKRFYHDFLRDN